MAYFPFFMDIAQGSGLIVGGGAVALRKAEKLLPYGAELTVCSPSFLPEFQALPGLTLLRGPFQPALLADRLFVIAATGDARLNREIAALCRERRIPVNAVDDRDACTFLFPALVRRGALSVGVCTGGASPSAAVYWKARIDGLIPQDEGELLDYLDGLRAAVKDALPRGGARSAALAALFQACRAEGWPLPPEALERLLAGAEEEAP